MSTDVLLEKLRAVGEEMLEAGRNMNETQRQLTADIFENLVDNVLPEGDIETNEGIMRLAAARTAMRFGSRFLDAMVGYTPAQIREAMDRLDEAQP